MFGSRGGLTTRGRCLLAAGLAAGLCALLLDERDLLRIAAFVVLLPMLALVVVSRGQRGLRAERDLLPARLPAGDRCEVRLAVRCPRGLGSGVLLQDELADELGAQPQFVVRLPRNAVVRLYYPLHPQQRGVHLVGPLQARTTDPFGLAECNRELAGSNHLTVLPAVVALTGRPAGGGLGAGADGTGQGPNRARPGQDDDSVVVRGYRHGDDLRRVHWRSTARRDELMVRVEERPRAGGTVLLLDHRSSAHRGAGPHSSLEYAVSLAASVWMHLRRQGHRVRLITADGRMLATAEDAQHSTDAALTALAALRPAQHSALPDGTALGDGRDVIAVLGACGPDAVGQLLALPARGLPSHAVLLDVAAWAQPAPPAVAAAPDPADAARTLIGAGWSVVVAQPQQPMAAVWAQLCLSSRTRQEAAQ